MADPILCKLYTSTCIRRDIRLKNTLISGLHWDLFASFLTFLFLKVLLLLSSGANKIEKICCGCKVIQVFQWEMLIRFSLKLMTSQASKFQYLTVTNRRFRTKQVRETYFENEFHKNGFYKSYFPSKSLPQTHEQQR